MFRKVIAILAGISVCVLAVVDDSNAFVYPGFGGPTDLDKEPWQVGSLRPIEWYTTIRTYNITLWQMGPPNLIGAVWEAPAESTQNVTFNWKVDSLGADLAVSNKFMLWGGFEIYKNASSGFTSYTFLISDSDAATSTTATGASSSTTTETSSTGTSFSASAAAPSSGSNSESLKIGLGVGLGVGLALLLLIGAWFGRGFLKQRMTRGEPKSGGSGLYGAHKYGSPDSPPQYGDAVKYRAELSSGEPETDYSKPGGAVGVDRVELSADRPVREM